METPQRYSRHLQRPYATFGVQQGHMTLDQVKRSPKTVGFSLVLLTILKTDWVRQWEGLSWIIPYIMEKQVMFETTNRSFCFALMVKTCGFVSKKSQDQMDGLSHSGLLGSVTLSKWGITWVPSGEHTKSNGKSPFLMGQSTISMAIFNSKLLVHQRVNSTSSSFFFLEFHLNETFGWRIPLGQFTHPVTPKAHIPAMLPAWFMHWKKTLI